MGRVWALLLTLLCAAAPADAAEPWREATSAHFVIYAQYSSQALRTYAEQLERFDKALRVLRRLPDAPVGAANRLRVFVVRNSEAVAKLAGAPGSGVAGFYHARAGGSIAVTSREAAQHWSDLTPQVVLLHEYTHHFMLRNFPAAYPAWFLEGFAEFNATAQFTPDGGIDIGAPANHRAYELAVVRRPDVPLMLSDPGNRRGVGSMELYAYGWLLTHYLTFNEARRGQLAAYLNAINRGTPAKAAAEAAFGNLNTLQREVRVYLAKRHMRVAHLAPAELAIGAIAIRDLTAGEAEMVPVAVRTAVVETGKPKRDIASDARSIAARFASDATVKAQLAEAELAGGDSDLAGAAADRAITADPQSLRALLVASEVALRRAAAVTAPADKARFGKAARQFAMRANRIDPDHPVPLLLFYRSFAAAGETPTENAVTGLTRAHLLAPEDGDLRLLLARQKRADGKLDEVRLLLTPIAYDPHGCERGKLAAALLAEAGGAGNAMAAGGP